MDEYSGKKASDGMFVSRKGSNLVLRDTANNRDQNAQFCNRIGCNGRLNTAKATQINFPEKAKSSKSSFRSSSNGKELVGSSSRTSNVNTNPRKSFTGPRKKMSSQPEREPSETGSLPEVPEVQEVVPPTEKLRKGIRGGESDDAGTSENPSTEVGSSSMPNTRSRRTFYQKSAIGKSESPAGSPISLAAKNANQRIRAGGGGGYGLRNLRCSTITDMTPTGSSTSDSKQKGTSKRRNCEGESSNSARGKKIGGSPFEGRNPSSGSGISISDSRRTRNGTSSPNQDNSPPASVRTRRSFSYTRARVANQAARNNTSSNEPQAVIPQVSHPVMPMDSTAPISLHQFSMEPPLIRPRSYRLPGISNDSLRSIRPSSPAEVGNIRSSTNRESFRRYNMDGIAEQLLVLETSLFLNGLNFYDQHRDMRLDIDNMSYEELLALEERMGTVSTALTEEALSECLKTSTYDSGSLKDKTSDLCGGKDDVKCSVCQEEYTVGDKLGKLQCEHRFHVSCIHQWLRLKNWCPICKASVSSSSSYPSPSSPSSSSSSPPSPLF
ncbi:E3 ubiquitin-protein ligase MBR2-like isoform X2 [Euphorbia lathyris]|uniref:E3 ubiquitin-protein ligase MBR2-like isoform X2 n=1 Tax=Euphorbia lathyris TaxID=212925 RepID=UPI0033138709